MSCADKIKDKSSTLGQSPNNTQREEMEQCVAKCGDEMIKLLPTFTKKMQDWFKNQSYLQ